MSVSDAEEARHQLTESYTRHGLRAMMGRKVTEQHRVATPLELLFDLTFVAAFGVAGSEFAHGIAGHHALAAALGFAFAMVAVILAWINYSWFASAFATDDWLFRILTMVQMVGVVVLAIGLPEMFASFERGQTVSNEVIVAGYVVMRVAMIAQWLRAANSNPKYRVVALTYVAFIGVAQLAWTILIFLPLEPVTFLVCALVISAIDWGGPLAAEVKGSRHGASTPWHAHHIAERYSLLAIITLGELVLGTLSAAQSITRLEGWSLASVTVIGLGVVMTFALWWVYFLVPSAPILAERRDKAFPWGYGHVIVFAATAAVGAGLHLVGYAYDEHYEVSTLTAITAIAAPVMVFMVALYLLHAWLVSSFPKNAPVQISAIALPSAAIVLAALEWPLWACLSIVVMSPAAIIVSFELGGWRTLDKQIAHSLSR